MIEKVKIRLFSSTLLKKSLDKMFQYLYNVIRYYEVSYDYHA